MGLEKTFAANTAAELGRGRARYRRRAWAEAYKSLSHVDRVAPLAADDLELLAMSAYLIARDSDYLDAIERAHNAHLRAGNNLRAIRCAFWLGLRLLFRGETGHATGWFSRARRLVDCEEQDCVEEGYVLLAEAIQQFDAGDDATISAVAAAAAAIGDSYGEMDLVVIARHLQGKASLRQGRMAEGMSLLDEAMLPVVAGELSPWVTGLIYCSVIEGCQQVLAMDRAREWTAALARWCEEQPEMVSFTGKCLVHRAEIMRLHGTWEEALTEAKRCCERFEKGIDPQRPAGAWYEQAEIHRLRGDFEAAEAAYRIASRLGVEPQPGLALLRMTQGRSETAVRAIRRVAGATTDPFRLAALLPAYVEIMLDAGHVADARAAAWQLEQIAERYDTGLLGAIAAHARGAVELAEGDAQAALSLLRRALQLWQEVDAPHEVARARFLAGLACRTLGDEEGAELELDAARAAFEQLQAAPDLARLERRAKDDDASGSLTG